MKCQDKHWLAAEHTPCKNNNKDQHKPKRQKNYRNSRHACYGPKDQPKKNMVRQEDNNEECMDVNNMKHIFTVVHDLTSEQR